MAGVERRFFGLRAYVVQFHALAILQLIFPFGGPLLVSEACNELPAEHYGHHARWNSPLQPLTSRRRKQEWLSIAPTHCICFCWMPAIIDHLRHVLF